MHDAADRFEHATAQELLAWAIETFHPRLAISAAGGVDGMAIIDMAWRIDPTIRVFTLDTGRLPPETYTLFEEVRERYGIQVEFETPDGATVAALQTEHGPNLMYRSLELRTLCCQIRKVDPLKRKLIDARRVDRGPPPRAVRQPPQHREGRARPRPRRHREAEPARRLDRRRTSGTTSTRTRSPTTSSSTRGYASIGCAPCTRAVLPGESERAGRWWWEENTNKECGIHCSVQLLGHAERQRTSKGRTHERRAGRSTGRRDRPRSARRSRRRSPTHDVDPWAEIEAREGPLAVGRMRLMGVYDDRQREPVHAPDPDPGRPDQRRPARLRRRHDPRLRQRVGRTTSSPTGSARSRRARTSRCTGSVRRSSRRSGAASTRWA